MREREREGEGEGEREGERDLKCFCFHSFKFLYYRMEGLTQLQSPKGGDRHKLLRKLEITDKVIFNLIHYLETQTDADH